MPIKSIFHVGSGPASKGPRTLGFTGDERQEIRLDIGPSVNPDINASITDLTEIAPSSVDAVLSLHNIEHLFPHEAPVAAYIKGNSLDSVAYMSGMGPITPLDFLYGHNALIRNGNVYMAHRTAFTKDTLQKALMNSGFRTALTLAKPAQFEIWAIASKGEQKRETMLELAAGHIPSVNAIREKIGAN